jgi:hypothetical protein
MYITAQRVKSRTDQIGINAFVHLHGEGDAAGIDWENIDISYISEQATGSLVSEHIKVTPGGNQVLSYLDVACPDDTPMEEMEQAVFYAKEALKTSIRPLARRFGQIVVRFGAIFGLEDAEGLEYDELARRLLELARQRTTPAWFGKPPLCINVTSSAERLTFRLADEDARRARDVKDVSLPLGVVHIDYDTYEDFERLHGDFMMHILPTVTGLSLEQLRALGGVSVVQAETGRILWEWPRRRERSS